jgi:EAL domain-containing protein (putative c-di-GMP-specific phosphodiesterase class I)
MCRGITDRDAALVLAGRVCDAVAEPLRVGDVDFFVTASVGIVFHSEGDLTAEDLLRDGNAAMSAAKRNGGNAGFFDEAASARDRARLQLETDLRLAIERDELRVFFQPVMDISTLEPVGVEALVRWQHPGRGLVLPGEFIPLAEETGMIIPVNLSMRQLATKGLPAVVASALREAGLSAERLCLELTESVLLSENAVAAANVSALNRSGVRFAIDDFGTGYSSFVHLKRYPVQRLKVDRSFVAGLQLGTEDVAIVAAIVAMAGALGLTTVAEGIESAEQLAQLEELGCDLGQGYLFSTALDPAQFLAFLSGAETSQRRSVDE